LIEERKKKPETKTDLNVYSSHYYEEENFSVHTALKIRKKKWKISGTVQKTPPKYARNILLCQNSFKTQMWEPFLWRLPAHLEPKTNI